MQIPVLRGLIDRRILANYRVEPEVMAACLPPPFRPKLVGGFAVAGICLIRLRALRPKRLPLPGGIASENAAHRVAVEWEDRGELREGVYIPRRDTNSRLSAWAGGLVFPGEHHLATFRVDERGDRYSVELRSNDGDTCVHVSGTTTSSLPSDSLFASTADASAFFEQGCLGYSDTSTPGRFAGLELRCHEWRVEPLMVDRVESSYFDDQQRFPPGSARFDHALLMRGIRHEWHGREDLCCVGEQPPA